MKQFYQFEKKDFKPLIGMFNYFQRITDKNNVGNDEIGVLDYFINIIPRTIIMTTYNFVLPTAVLVTVGIGLEKLISK